MIASVQQADTTTTVSLMLAAATPIFFGQPLEVVANVGVVAPGAGVPTGMVVFRDGDIVFGNGVLDDSGRTSVYATNLAVGQHSITAMYNGDLNFKAKVSPPLTQMIQQASTTTTMSMMPDNPVVGQAVTLTATVSSTVENLVTLSGTITFKDGNTALNSPVSIDRSGRTSLGVANLSAGQHSITAVYSGNTNYKDSSSSALIRTISQASTATDIEVTPATSAVGHSVTVAVSVKAKAPGAGTPEGRVTLKDGDTTIGSSIKLQSGQASFTTSALTAGDHELTVEYSGDASFLASVSLPAKIKVLAAARTSYVDARATGKRDGAAWADAYTNLQDALAAAESGTDIWVAAGTYTPSTTAADGRKATFTLKSGVALYGGFNGTETQRNDRKPATNLTILSGAIGVPGDPRGNCYHVVTCRDTDDSAVLDGFTITGGNANGAFANGFGGGMYNQRSNPTLANLIFENNAAIQNGGAMRNDHSHPALTNVTFRRNTAGSLGGAIANNASDLTLINVVFNGNSAGQNGGAIANWASSPALINVAISGNSAGQNGGAIANFAGSNPALVNVTISGNAAHDGGALANIDDSSPRIANCILWGNAAPNGSQLYNAQSSAPSISFSLVQGWNMAPGTDGPAFVRAPTPGTGGRWGAQDDDYGDLNLKPGSPGIDTGNNDELPAVIRVGLDLAGHPRIANGRVDMGAYEQFTPPDENA